MSTIWRVIGIGAVAVVWLVSAGANFWAGMQLAPDSAGGVAYYLGGASVASDVLKTVCLFLIVAAVADKRWGNAAVASFIMLLCVTWSLRSAVYFSSSMIAGRVAERTLDNKILTAELDLVEISKQRAQFLARQTIKLPGSGRPLREALIKEKKRVAEEYAKATDQIKTSLEKARKAKPRSSVDPLAEITGLSEQILLLFTALAFATLTEFISGAGLWAVASRDRKRAPPSPVRTEAPDRPKEEYVVGFGGKVVPAPKPKPVKPPAPKTAQETAVELFVKNDLRRSPGGKCLCVHAVSRCMEYLDGTLRKPERDALAKLVLAEVEKKGGSRKKTSGAYHYLDVVLTERNQIR